MAITAEPSLEHIGETAGMKDHDRDIVHELSKRLDCLWRCDQYIANAEGHDDLVNFWHEVKHQEQRNIDQLRAMIRSHIGKECF